MISQQIGKSTRHIEYDLLKILNIFESETIGETQNNGDADSRMWSAQVYWLGAIVWL